KIPQVSQIGRTVWTNSKAFVVRAGTIIFCLSVILWAMAYYPRLPEERVQEVYAAAAAEGDKAVAQAMEGGAATLHWVLKDKHDNAVAAVASAQLEHSISGRLGHMM